MSFNPMSRGRRLLAIILLLTVFVPQQVLSHGGVAFEDDYCVISIEFLNAHFTVFQPETRDTSEYCEDIPDVARSVFVMEYLHDSLQYMPIDFRIIRDVDEIGKYAQWEDVEAMGDLEDVTVYYEPPRIEPGGYYRASYEFEEKGTYIGIVSAKNPDTDRVYRAVFYFRVGGIDFGSFPMFLALLVVLQGSYWLANGGLQRRRERLNAAS